MKIHLFFRSLNEKTGGGSHFNAIAYVRALRKRGHTVTVHTFSSGHNASPPDIELIEHSGRGKGLMAGRNYLAKLLSEYESEADVFFLYAVEFAWGGGLYRKRGGRVPVAVYLDAYLSSMGYVHVDSWKMKWYGYKRLPWDKTVGLSDAAHVDQFLPCSPFVKDAYIRFGFPADRFTVLPNIVAPLPDTGEVSRNTNAVNVLYVGRLIHDKGIDLLIDALVGLTRVPWRLTIVGDGEMRVDVERRMREGKLPIELHGWVPQHELGRFYRAADIFVHPARWPEPFGRTIVEAMSCGIPVIVPQDGGSSWIAGDAGLVFKNGDRQEIQNMLKRLLSDATLRRELAAKAPARARMFDENVVAVQLETLLFDMYKNTV